MTTAYKFKDHVVVEVECPEGMKYPLHDADGDTIYINSHYATKQEAYVKAIEDCDAGISLAASSIESHRNSIRKLQEAMSDYAIAKNRLAGEQRRYARELSDM